MIPFTQYLRPHGRRRAIQIQSSPEVEAKAKQILTAGYQFEVEVLTTGDVSLTIVDSRKGDVAIQVCRNGPDVPVAVERLITEFNL